MFKNFPLFIFLILFSSYTSYTSAETKGLRWNIKNNYWTQEFELAYSNFIRTLGKARKNGVCKTTNECLRSNVANPLYAHKNPSKLIDIFSDCADLPYILRAYFAWMNDLPFSYPTDLIEAEHFSHKDSDIRYSKFGNIITNKHLVLNRENINRVLQDVADMISTASFRTNASLYDQGNLFRDTYPVDIDRKAIIPGTIVYDPNGHVAVVYDVSMSGQIFLIDAHPDNSLTTITYGEKFARSKVLIGAGFSNFRPFGVENGKVRPTRNSDLSHFSLLQYSSGPFIFKGQKLTFYEYVRAKLADGDIIYDPVTEFGNFLDELCQDIQYRKEAVDIALSAGIHERPHPELLPSNIYGADGEWEAYATPGRDARLKASVRETKKYLSKVINGYQDQSLLFKEDDIELVDELRSLYLMKSSSCKIIPLKNIEMNLDTVLQKLFTLSFDPYHCPELRWGMECVTSLNKKKWYLAEQGLRNRVDRDYTIRTDYNVDDLPKASASQVERPDLSIDELLHIERK